ncbi:MAG: cache domain-containing protein, partial [Oscillospiraceae bacterium]
MSNIKSGKDKSLKKKIMLSSVSALLVLAIVMGTVSVSMVNKLSRLHSQKIMTQLCDNETLQFDNKLNLVQHSVDTINEYAENLMKINGITDVYSDEYEHNIKEFAIAVANQTIGAVSVYFRYNPEVTGSGTDGFFWTKRTDSEMFNEETITDILAYNSSDTGHVGWFYIPKETGRPLWMSPYYNKNLDIFMISYIIPMYHENGEFIGVIGMDIDFAAIINESYDIDVFDSSSVGFVDLKERIVYYSDDDGTVHDRKLSNKFYNHITTINRFNDLLEITDEQGSTSVILCKKLSNGMM